MAWPITVLHRTHGLTLEAASASPTGYMIGMMSGVLLGGWVADRTDRHFAFVFVGAALWLTSLFFAGSARAEPAPAAVE